VCVRVHVRACVRACVCIIILIFIHTSGEPEAASPRASLGRRTVYGRTDQHRPQGSKRCETKVRMVWGSFLFAPAALNTPARSGYDQEPIRSVLAPPEVSLGLRVNSPRFAGSAEPLQVKNTAGGL